MDLKSHLVAVHEDSEDVDLVDQGLDGRPAADAEAEDKVVDDEQGVDHQHGPPASGPAAQSKVKAPQPNCYYYYYYTFSSPQGLGTSSNT